MLKWIGVKNTLVSSEDKGFDTGKKIKSRKSAHQLYIYWLLLAVVFQSASV